MNKEIIKKYTICAVMGLGFGLLYIRGLYIVSMGLLTISVFLINSKSSYNVFFEGLNIVSFIFVGTIIFNGILFRSMELVEMIIMVCMGFDLMSIWISLCLFIKYLVKNIVKNRTANNSNKT